MRGPCYRLVWPWLWLKTNRPWMKSWGNICHILLDVDNYKSCKPAMLAWSLQTKSTTESLGSKHGWLTRLSCRHPTSYGMYCPNFSSRDNLFWAEIKVRPAQNTFPAYRIGVYALRCAWHHQEQLPYLQLSAWVAENFCKSNANCCTACHLHIKG